MTHTHDTIMALAYDYAEQQQSWGVSHPRTLKEVAALSAAIAEVLAERDQLRAEVERLRGDKETLLSHMDTFMRVSNDPAIYNLAKVVIDRLASGAAPKDEAMDKLVKLSEELGLYDGAAQKENTE